MTGHSRLDVTVVGVSNIDLMTRVPRLPSDGEWVFGSPIATLPGGKGLNQAIAVTRAGGRAAIVTKAGDDVWGAELLSAAQHAGVDTTAFTVVPGGRTAAVMIQVPPSGDSAAVVTRTSTTMLDPDDVERGRRQLAEAAVSLVQLEFDTATIDRAVSLAGGTVIGTLPPLEPLPVDLLARLDMLVLNGHEAGTMLQAEPVRTVDEAHAAAARLLGYGPNAIAITLGRGGVVYLDRHSQQHHDARTSQPIDTSGAGDAFLGALATGLARRRPITEAIAAGVEAGARAVERFGAQMGTSGTDAD